MRYMPYMAIPAIHDHLGTHPLAGFLNFPNVTNGLLLWWGFDKRLALVGR